MPVPIRMRQTVHQCKTAQYWTEYDLVTINRILELYDLG
jgi:hypothetical protein